MNSEAEGLLAAASKGLCPLYLLFPGPGEITFLRAINRVNAAGKPVNSACILGTQYICTGIQALPYGGFYVSGAISLDKLPTRHIKQPDQVPDAAGNSDELQLEGHRASSSEGAAAGGAGAEPTQRILKTPAYILLAVDGTWR